MTQWLEQANRWIQPVLWGWPVLLAILLAGVLFFVRLKGFPLTHVRLWMHKTLGSLFCRRRTSGEGEGDFFLPGADHRLGGVHRHREHCGCGDGPHARRAGGDLLDVGIRGIGDGHDVCRNGARDAGTGKRTGRGDFSAARCIIWNTA